MPKRTTLLIGLAVTILLTACGSKEGSVSATEPASTPIQRVESPAATPATVENATEPSQGSSPIGSASDPASTPLPDYDIITLLPRDAIPAIFEPEFLSAGEANTEYDDSELVIGVEIDGDARAYSIPYLSGREIVNDTVGGRPIAVTW